MPTPNRQTEQVYLRRVQRPEPLLEELARTAVDSFGDKRPRPAELAAVSREACVPIDYLLDELERRVRERV